MKYLFFISFCFFSFAFASENSVVLNGSSLERIKNPFSFLTPKSKVIINSIDKKIIIPVETDLSNRNQYHNIVPKEFVINNSEIENIVKIYLEDKREVPYKTITVELLSGKINILFNEFEDERIYTLSDVILDLEFKIIKDGVATIKKSSMNKTFGNEAKDFRLTLTTDDFNLLKVNEAIKKEFEYSIFKILK
ncbi:hypothetical protein [Arcobacter aquimarinus]|uniref:hypothetical protein n=1 Tax=Arcobacter aquimarinus TaxID=1315211 RepID=UPI003BAFC759